MTTDSARLPAPPDAPWQAEISRRYVEGDLHGVMCAHDRNQSPALLWSFYEDGLLERRGDVASLVAHAWSACEVPAMALDDEQWRELFDLAPFVTDVPGTTRPEGPITVYRAAPEPHRFGWSWTTDLDVARQFKQMTMRQMVGACERSTIWTTVIEPWEVLGIIAGRDESEVILDPDLLASETLAEVA